MNPPDRHKLVIVVSAVVEASAVVAQAAAFAAAAAAAAARQHAGSVAGPRPTTTTSAAVICTCTRPGLSPKRTHFGRSAIPRREWEQLRRLIHLRFAPKAAQHAPHAA